MSKSKAPGLKQKNSTKRLVTAYPIQARVKPIGRADFPMKVIVHPITVVVYQVGLLLTGPSVEELSVV